MTEAVGLSSSTRVKYKSRKSCLESSFWDCITPLSQLVIMRARDPGNGPSLGLWGEVTANCLWDVLLFFSVKFICHGTTAVDQSSLSIIEKEHPSGLWLLCNWFVCPPAKLRPAQETVGLFRGTINPPGGGKASGLGQSSIVIVYCKDKNCQWLWHLFDRWRTLPGASSPTKTHSNSKIEGAWEFDNHHYMNIAS